MAQKILPFRNWRPLTPEQAQRVSSGLRWVTVSRVPSRAPKTEAERALGPQVHPIVLPITPFNIATCTMANFVSNKEQAAFDACIRANKTIHEFWQNAAQADWMLDVLRDRWDTIPPSPERQLRTFALRCVEQIRVPDTPGTARVLAVVKRRIDGDATLDELRAAQELIRGGVTAGGIQGLPRLIGAAAAMLAVWHTADRSPFEAAFWAAEFAARYDGCVAVQELARNWRDPDDRGEAWRESWHAAEFNTAHPNIFQAAVTESRRRQAALLRSLLPDPFVLGPPVRVDVFFGPANDAKQMPVYCIPCGSARGDTSKGVVFHVRGMTCAGCHRSLDSVRH